MAERDVLVVDDERQVREVLQQILTLSGYTCRLVGDGGEALEVFKVWRPPLVVTDVLHPGITGIELLRQVRAVDQAVAVVLPGGGARVDHALVTLQCCPRACLLSPVDIYPAP